jgi:DNA repair protein SbcC/Rad50
MIRSITLNNWKTHKNTKIEFNKGTNLFIGQMGSGKSSIVDAICYALFGSFPSLQNRKIKLDEVIMFKPQKEKQAKIILELVIDQNNYRIEREIISEKTNTAKLYKNDKLIFGPKQTDVNQAVSEILNIDYNLFVKIVYGEQNELDYFLKLAPAKRKEQFDDLFGISQLDLIKDNAKKVLLDLEKKRENFSSLKEQISSQIKEYDIETINKELEEYSQHSKNLTDQISTFSLKKESVLKEYEKANLDKKSYEQKLLNLKVTEKHIEDSQKVIADFEKNQNDFFNNALLFLKEELLKQKQEFNEKQKHNFLIDSKRKDLENKQTFYNNQEFKLLEEKKQLEHKLQKLSKDKTQIEFEKKLMDTEYDSLHSKKLEFLNQIKELNTALLELKKGFFNCPVCDSVLTEKQISEKTLSKTEDLKQTKENLNKILEELENNSKIKKQLKDDEEKIKTNDLLLENIKKTDKEILIIKENLIKTEEEFKNLEKKENLEKYDSLITNLDLAIKYQEKKEDLLKLLEKKEIFTKDLSLQKFDEEKYTSLIKELGSLDLKLDSLKTQKENLLKNISLLEKNKKSYLSLVDQKEKQEEILKKLNQHSTDLSHFIKAVESSQKQLRKVLVDNINKILSVIWLKIYPYNDYLSARLRVDSDYILEVLTIQKEWIRVEGLLSGGERTCAALSIRVAIALCLTKNLGLLVLDEPTHNLDYQGILMLSKVIDEDLPELVDQIFIVTHEKQLLTAVSALKFSVLRDKENDGVTEIS